MKALYILAALAVAGPSHAQTNGSIELPNGGPFYCPGDPRCLTTRGTPPHRYTVAEIDRMREAIWKQLGATASYREKYTVIELRLQTYIAAGITAEELEKGP